MAKSAYLEVNILNHVLRATPYAAPAAVYLAAYTTAPTDAGGGVEVSGGAYTRQLVTFSEPVENRVANDADILFPIATVPWGTVLHFGIFDAPAAGNFLYHTAMSAPRNILAGDQLRVPVGQLIVEER